MQIKYKIIDTDIENQTIVVRFYTDTVTEESLATDIDQDGKIIKCSTDLSLKLFIANPTDEELHSFILAFTPKTMLEIKEATITGDFADTFRRIDLLKNVEVVDQLGGNRPPVPNPIQLDQETLYKAAIQDLLDLEANKCGFDNIVSACSYAALPGKYQAEAVTFFNWRSDVWEYCGDLLNDINVGTKDAPELEELLASLPTRVLP